MQDLKQFLPQPLRQVAFTGFSYLLFRLQDVLRLRFLLIGNKQEGKINPIGAQPGVRYSGALLLPAFAFTTFLSGPILLGGQWRIVRRAFTFKSIFYQRSIWLLSLGLLKTQIMQPFWQINFEQGLLLPFTFTTRAWINFFETGLYQYVNLFLNFSGYTDIVVGVSAMLGLKIRHNFKQPYLACSLRDFWRRWHITLAEWVKRHVYIPLGGSRVDHLRWARNILVSMILIGIWHGLAWNFLIWGILHGLCLIFEKRLILPALDKYTARGQNPRIIQIGGRMLGWTYTQLFVLSTWVFFFWK